MTVKMAAAKLPTKTEPTSMATAAVRRVTTRSLPDLLL